MMKPTQWKSVMKMPTMYKTVGLALSALLLTACASKGSLDNANAELEERADTLNDQATQAVDSAVLSAEELKAQAEAKLLEMTVFYFEFDQSTIKEESKDALKAHAKYLANSNSARITLEGHADERGTIEYNLALGERRAMSVRRFLMANGANAEQIKVVSYGEERPAVMGQSEEAYSKNRRVEVKYQSR